jgi:uncharacterized protein
VRLHLDASLLVAIFIEDALSANADALLASNTRALLVSDFAAAEFPSALALVRMGELSAEAAHAAFANFDAWTARLGPRLRTEASDVIDAEGFLRRLDLNLRTADALNIAIVRRHGLTLATFDHRMAAVATTLGLATV